MRLTFRRLLNMMSKRTAVTQTNNGLSESTDALAADMDEEYTEEDVDEDEIPCREPDAISTKPDTSDLDVEAISQQLEGPSLGILVACAYPERIVERQNRGNRWSSFASPCQRRPLCHDPVTITCFGHCTTPCMAVVILMLATVCISPYIRDTEQRLYLGAMASRI